MATLATPHGRNVNSLIVGTVVYLIISPIINPAIYEVAFVSEINLITYKSPMVNARAESILKASNCTSVIAQNCTKM